MSPNRNEIGSNPNPPALSHILSTVDYAWPKQLTKALMNPKDYNEMQVMPFFSYDNSPKHLASTQ